MFGRITVVETSVKMCLFCRLRAKIIDGKAIAKEIKDEVRSDVEAWVAGGHRCPKLTAVIVGEDPASHTYVKNKMAAAKYTS